MFILGVVSMLLVGCSEEKPEHKSDSHLSEHEREEKEREKEAEEKKETQEKIIEELRKANEAQEMRKRR